MADRRIGNIKLNNQYKGDLFEELICKWREDNYKTPIDYSRDPKLGRELTRLNNEKLSRFIIRRTEEQFKIGI